MTFSIAAYDPEAGAFGVAVASKFLAVGSVVSWARADAGAVATQSFAKVTFGPDGLALMAAGGRAADVLAALLRDDPQREQRQVGIVDRHGGSAAHTGAECYAWAGHVTGEGFACQGNILTGEAVVQAMAEAYRATSGALESRLYAALVAGDAAGGDSRGRQSAALLVAKPNGGYGGDNDRYLDLRVDDHRDPVTELGGLLTLHALYFGKARPEDLLPIDGDLARELQAMLIITGDRAEPVSGVWDAASRTAFRALVGRENLEERWSVESTPDHLDKVALTYLRRRFGR